MESLSDRLDAECDAAKRHLMIERELCPPEPQLLDTCALQGLDWVDRQLEALGSVHCDEAARNALMAQRGEAMADDLIALGCLYKEFEGRDGYPWLVCNVSIEESEGATGIKGSRLREIISFIRGHQECIDACSFPSLAGGLLWSDLKSSRVSPLILKALGVQSPEDIGGATGPLNFLPDDGDRLIAAQALVANVPVILTTDRKTFWNYRARLRPLGVAVMRPSELLHLYESYWDACDAESERRRREAGPRASPT